MSKLFCEAFNFTPQVTSTDCVKGRELFNLTNGMFLNPNFKKAIMKPCNGRASAYMWLLDKVAVEYEPTLCYNRLYAQPTTYLIEGKQIGKNTTPGAKVQFKIGPRSHDSTNGRLSPGAKGAMISFLDEYGLPATGKIIDKDTSIAYNHILTIAPYNGSQIINIKDGEPLQFIPVSAGHLGDCLPNPFSSGGRTVKCIEGTIGKIKRAVCITEEEMRTNPEGLLLFSMPKIEYTPDGDVLCEEGSQSCYYSEKMFDGYMEVMEAMSYLDMFGNANTNELVIGETDSAWDGMFPIIRKFGKKEYQGSNSHINIGDIKKLINRAKSEFNCTNLNAIHGGNVWDDINAIALQLLGTGNIVHYNAGNVIEGCDGSVNDKCLSVVSYNRFTFGNITLHFNEMPEWQPDNLRLPQSSRLQDTIIVYPECSDFKGCHGKGPESRFVRHLLQGCSGLDGSIVQTVMYGGSLASRLGQTPVDECSQIKVSWEADGNLEVICPEQFTILLPSQNNC